MYRIKHIYTAHTFVLQPSGIPRASCQLLSILTTAFSIPESLVGLGRPESIPNSARMSNDTDDSIHHSRILGNCCHAFGYQSPLKSIGC